MYQLKIPFERVAIDTQTNQTRTPEFLLINPNGKVPALRLQDGKILTESNAMLWFLAENTQYLLARHGAVGHATQLAVDERSELLERTLVAVAPCEQQGREVGRPVRSTRRHADPGFYSEHSVTVP
jgi:glutathione S-transferase